MRQLLLSAFLLSGCTIVGVPPVEVSGTVRSVDGAPIANATVALRSFAFSLWRDPYEGVLQLTRTDPDGRYRFVAAADREFHFPAERRNYHVTAFHEEFVARTVRPIDAPLSAPLDLVLEPSRRGWHDALCIRLCPSADFAECRRVAEFHFGDKTRCDRWREEFRREFGGW